MFMRVVSLAPSNTEILYRIGVDNELVATTSLCNYPEEAMDKPSLGGWSKGIKTDKLAGHNPDLVVCSDSLQDRVVEKLESMDFEVLHLKPRTLAEVYGSILEIGRAVDREAEAEKTVECMREELEKISINGTRIYCEEWLEPPHFSGNWVPGVIEAIDGKYFVEEGTRSDTFELEELRQFCPEHIILSICGAGEKVSDKAVKDRESWKDITAVETGNIHILDDSLLNRPGPRLVEAAKEIEKIVDSRS